MATSELEIADADIARAEPPPSGERERRWPWAAGFVIGGLVLLLAYLRQAGLMAVQSDGASNALQSWDMLHGNLLLHGWTLTDISFYTVDLPLYMLTEAVRGLGPGAAHLASALTYTLVVAGAALLAKGRVWGKEGLVRALVAAGIMLAPTLGSTSGNLLNLPDHTGTQIPLLAAWLILDRAQARWDEGRPRWRWLAPAAVMLVLAWGQIADPIVAYEGVLPVVLVCAIRLYHRRDLLAARRWTEFLHERWYELSLAVGAICAAGIAELALRLIRAAGGFSISPPVTTFSPVGELASHLSVTADSILVVFGADFSGARLGSGAIIPLLHLIGVALVCWAVARALRRFGGADIVVQILAVAMVVLLAAYTFSGSPNVISGPHEIVGIVPIGAALAGRLLAGSLVAGRHLILAAVLLVCNCLVLAHNVTQQPPGDSNVALAALLEEHHLSYGLATYWNASSVTVDSGGRVTVRPVNRNQAGKIDSIARDSVPSWYDPRQHDADFLVIPPPYKSCVAGTKADWLTQVKAQFGAPTATYHRDGFTVMVWDKNLLGLIAPPEGGAC